MRFKFKSKKLEILYTSELGARKYPAEVVDAFFDAVGVIESAADERDLYALKSLHYEKLRGDRKSDRSIRLNKQFRLTLRPEEDEDGKLLFIIDIENHYE